MSGSEALFCKRQAPAEQARTARTAQSGTRRKPSRLAAWPPAYLPPRGAARRGAAHNPLLELSGAVRGASARCVERASHGGGEVSD